MIGLNNVVFKLKQVAPKSYVFCPRIESANPDGIKIKHVGYWSPQKIRYLTVRC